MIADPGSEWMRYVINGGDRVTDSDKAQFYW